MLALVLNPPGKNEPTSPLLRERAQTYLSGRPASPDRLRREIADLGDELADLQRVYSAEAEAWQKAVAGESERLVDHA